MKKLKRLIAVYDEEILVKGHYFKVETSKDIMKDSDDSIYELYDNKGFFIVGTIRSYKGLIEVAEAYITGDKQTLEDAKTKNCIIY